jgi:hypothetical protein
LNITLSLPTTVEWIQMYSTLGYVTLDNFMYLQYQMKPHAQL